MDDDLFYRRQGFWLRMARERAGKNQSGAAVKIGLEPTSKSTISDYENAVQVAPQPVLRTLARWYAVPIDLFQRPPLTSDEVIQRVIDRAERHAADVEQRDWEEGRDRGQEADDEPDAGRGRQPA